MVKIVGVEAKSLAARKRLRAGDILLSINQNEINDVLDYRFYLTEERVELLVMRGEKYRRVKIKKEEYEDIGLLFETPLMDKKHSCKNGCIFCFIDQNPKGLRDTLYFKDDDSRLSFLHGNYITLTNMTDSDVERIIKMRFSPINISIHTTDPELRRKMMKNKRAGEVLKYLKSFRDAGLSMCGQIVLCRGVNDGEALMRSMNDLKEYFPSLTSVSIVPAGLTKHREGLYPLSDFTSEEAGNIVDMIDSVANAQKEAAGVRLFYAADELYLKSGRKIPDAEYYDGYPQIENGVGMLRSFIDEVTLAEDDIRELLADAEIERTVSVVTGVAAYPMISDVCDRIKAICPKIQINVYKIVNNFYGESITVSGLLTGHDILEQLSGKPLGEALLIPENSLSNGGAAFLCGMTPDELSVALATPVCPVASSGEELVRAVLGI